MDDRMRIKGTLHSEPFWAGIVIILAAMMIFVRSTKHIPIGDELRYYYKFELKPGENYFNFNNLKPVRTIGDVIESQINHYKCVNGRIPVHFVEQIIAAKGWLNVFYVVNAMAFAGMVLLFLRLTLPAGKRRTAAAALAAAIGFLYLFPVPSRLWMSVNLALNYLWPSLASIATLVLLRRATTGRWHPRPLTAAAVCLLGFLTGWSNEAFAFPLSGATVIYFALNLRKLNYAARLIVIPLWAGSVAMLLSPGNWIRAAQATETIGSFMTVLLELKILWLLALTAAIYAAVSPRRLKRFIVDNPIPATALALAIGMGVIAHTAARAFTAIELFAAILMMRAAAPLIHKLNSRSHRIAFATLLTIMTVHQTAVSIEHYRQYISIRAALKDYRNSATGTVRYDYRPAPQWLAPFVYTQVPTPEGADYEWRLLGVSRCGTRKPFMALSANTYDNIDTMRTSAPASSALYPFVRIGNAYVTPIESTTAAKYMVTDSNGRQWQIACRKFFSPGLRMFVTLIPPVAGIKYTNIKAL